MKIYELELQVRDYECDVQGIVNNAIYQSYFEHTRHEFLNSIGCDFNKLRAEGWDPVVVHAEIKYLASLRPRDRFLSTLSLQKVGRIRLLFEQKLTRISDRKVVAKAHITSVFKKNGRPTSPDPLEKIVALQR